MQLNKIINILLYPESFFKRITNRKFSLIVGILIVGVIDVAFPLYYASNSSKTELFLNNLYFLIPAIVLVGAIDVIFLALPLYDLFRAIGKKLNAKNIEGNVIKIMKIYIYSHFIITPINVLFFSLYGLAERTLNPFLIIFLSFSGLLLMLWGTGIMAKGLRVLFEIEKKFTNLTFLIVFIWEYLVGSALGYLIDNWVMRLFTI